MLTRSKAKLGEGEIVEGDPEIGSRRTFSRDMSFAHGEEEETKEKEKPLISENELLESFVNIKAMVELLLEERAERKKEEKGKGVGGDGDPPDTNQTFSFSHASHSNNANASPRMPYFKLDVKFELSIYDGDLNAEKLDYWIKQLEVYCRVQGINDDPYKIKLATLRMSGMALTWWESKIQQDLWKNGKIISVWNEFIEVLRKQFYPLGHMQQLIMSWQSFRQGKGQSIQEYTHEFRKRAICIECCIGFTRDSS